MHKTSISLTACVLLILSGCASLTDKDGNTLCSSKAFGRDIGYTEKVEYYESGAIKSHLRVYYTQETVSPVMEAFNKIIGTTTGAAKEVL